MSPDGEETGEEEVKKCQREDEHKARKGPRSLIYFPGGGGKFLKGHVDLCRILVGGSLLVPCSLPGPPVVSVFSSLLPGKGKRCRGVWAVAGQS